MTRTALTTLALLVIVGLLIARSPVDASGAEECLGCRRLRGVELRWGFRSEELAPLGPTDRWVAKHLPEHEHRFVRTGCWEEGDAWAARQQPRQFAIPADLWLAHLKDLPLDDAREAVAAFNGDRDDAAYERAKDAYDAWFIRRRDGTGSETCSGCRLERTVHVRGGVRSVEPRPEGELAAWVREQVPEHEHLFLASGCWNDGRIVGSLAVPRTRSWPVETWSAYLQELPPESVAAAVHAFTHGTPEFETWNADVQRWVDEWHALGRGRRDL